MAKVSNDDLLVLAADALEGRTDHGGDMFLNNWRLIHRINDRGDVFGVFASNAHPTIYVTMTRLDDGKAVTIAANCLTQEIDLGQPVFLSGGTHVGYGERFDGLCCYNVLLIAFRAEKGARRIRYLRDDEQHVAEVRDDGMVIISDLQDAAPLDRFEAVEIGDQWRPCVADCFPYTRAAAARDWANYQASWENDEGDWYRWIGHAFHEVEGDLFMELIVELLKGLDAKTQLKGLHMLGAGPIYGSGHAFYDRVESDHEIPPVNLFEALSMERPEFLEEDEARRYHALMNRLTQQIKRPH